ncbi:MAG: DUF6783 domain-containing protein [Blautia faecis]
MCGRFRSNEGTVGYGNRIRVSSPAKMGAMQIAE